MEAGINTTAKAVRKTQVMQNIYKINKSLDVLASLAWPDLHWKALSTNLATSFSKA